jgi:aryl-alcohol dehydrogenase-like predicted oxidoreductase
MPISLPGNVAVHDLLDDLDRLTAAVRTHFEDRENSRYRREELYDFEAHDALLATRAPTLVAAAWELSHPGDETPITEGWTVRQTEDAILYDSLEEEEEADRQNLQKLIGTLARALTEPQA